MSQEAWWLIFPVLGMCYGLLAMWLRHKRRAAQFELLQTYITQGKEPPPALLAVLQEKTGALHTLKSVTIYGSLAFGFGLLALIKWHDGDGGHGFLRAAIVLGSLAVGMLIYAFIQTKHENK